VVAVHVAEYEKDSITFSLWRCAGCGDVDVRRMQGAWTLAQVQGQP